MGLLMSRSQKGSKGPGYDYGAKRPGNMGYCNSPSPGVKRLTVKKERAQEKELVRKETNS